jgi:uncharacterized FAD-dependent dehydrogenase
MQQLQLIVSPEESTQKDLLKTAVARQLNIDKKHISIVQIERKSIDARSRQIKVNLTVNVFFADEQPEKPDYSFHYQSVENKPEVIVAGAGPAGLFAALRLIELGLKPIVLERGKAVSERKRDIAQLCRNNGLNPESNYCFGEGGAGTFSDGKLYTRSRKKGDFIRIFRIFHYHGAQDNILYEAHPHIGSDILPEVIKNIRKTILDCGGEVHFEKKITDFIIENNAVKGVITADGDKIFSKVVILATGHSARDIYELLHSKNIALESKGFAMGVRVEHPQELIDSIQYKLPDRGEFLPAASYNLVEQVDGRGVYSFCMCPGGMIVPASTAGNETVVNGMSMSKRNSPFANSGIVVEIRPEDLSRGEKSFAPTTSGALAGLHFQRFVENLAFVNGNTNQIAPAQRLADFAARKLNADLPECSYLPGVISSPLHFWLPDGISTRLREGFKLFDRKMRGFLTNEALIVGVESRSSSPVRIPRDAETFQHPQIAGLFPCGEGAGYAGGITSSAIDGENCAEKVYRYFAHLN